MFTEKHYPEKILRGVDLAFNDPRETLPGLEESAYKIVEPRSKTYKRARALFGLIRQSMPESFWEKMGTKEYLRDYSEFPIDPNSYSLKHRVGSGNQCDCFLLENLSNPEIEASLVLKAFQTSGNSLEEVQNKGRQVKQDYDTLCEWYSDMTNLIPEQWQIIMSRFQRPHDKPMLAVIQRFLGSGIRDVALDFSDKQWQSECQSHPGLLEDLKKFVKITRKKIISEGKILDLLGRDNLAVAYFKAEPRLVFLDPDGIDEFKHMGSKASESVYDRLNLLEHRANIA
jgi:hypothetical protein